MQNAKLPAIDLDQDSVSYRSAGHHERVIRLRQRAAQAHIQHIMDEVESLPPASRVAFSNWLRAMIEEV